MATKMATATKEALMEMATATATVKGVARETKGVVTKLLYHPLVLLMDHYGNNRNKCRKE